VPDDLPVVPDNQREAILRRDGLPQGIDQVGHDRAVVTERPQVDLPHGLFVARKFFAKLHAWMVRTPPGNSHTILSRTQTAGHSAGKTQARECHHGSFG
jgi:hypothetical protein